VRLLSAHRDIHAQLLWQITPDLFQQGATLEVDAGIRLMVVVQGSQLNATAGREHKQL